MWVHVPEACNRANTSDIRCRRLVKKLRTPKGHGTRAKSCLLLKPPKWCDAALDTLPDTLHRKP